MGRLPLGGISNYFSFDIAGAPATSTPTVSIPLWDTTGLADGDFVYVSGATVLSLSDAATSAGAKAAGAFEGVTGQITISGIIENAKFTTDGGQPANGAWVFLAESTSDGGTGAGKLSSIPPSQAGRVAVAGLVKDNANYAASKTAEVIIDIRQPLAIDFGWVPSDEGGQAFWFDAADPATLWQDVAMSMPAVLDGDPIGSIVDKFGNYNGVATSKPVLKVPATVAANNKNSIGFTATSNNIIDLGNQLSLETDNFSLFFVAVKYGVGNTTIFNLQADNTAGSKSGHFTRGSAGGLVHQVAVTNTTSNDQTAPTAFPAGVAKAFSIIKDGTILSMYSNGILIGKDLGYPASINFTGAIKTTQLGALRNSAGDIQLFDGELMEIFYYTDAKSPGVRANAETYFAIKYGV